MSTGYASTTPPRFRSTDLVGQLLELAEQLSDLLVPVQPDGAYRRRVKGDLLVEAERRAAERARREGSPLRQHRKGIILGAAALGSVASVVGVIIAFVVRYRHGRADIACV